MDKSLQTAAVLSFATVAFVSLAAPPARTGSAEDNIPEATTGAMPADAVLDLMETAASPETLAAFKKAHPAPFHLFAEERRFAVRNNIVPAHWFSPQWIAKRGDPSVSFRGTAQPGEFYPFQVCVVSDKERAMRWTAVTPLKTTAVTPRDFKVQVNGVKPVWVMLDIPVDAAGKTLKGAIRIADAASGEAREMPFEIAVSGPVLKDGGISDAWRLSRLKWLESDVGCEDTVVKPYEPLAVDRASRTVKMLGRELVLGADGLPARIVSHFSGSNTHITDDGFDILAAPFAFRPESAAVAQPRAPQKEFAFTQTGPARVSWRAASTISGVPVRVEGTVDFTGSGSLRILTPGARLGKASLEIKMPADAAPLMEGLGRNGGFFRDGTAVEQKWSENRRRDAVWAGRVNGGLAVRFKGANYRHPLANAYYAWRPLAQPESWASGDGVITAVKKDGVATISATGRDAPEGAEWNVEFYITPFRKLDMKSHLSERYCHLGGRNSHFDSAAIVCGGANIVNLHHNTVWNPYINYPYNEDAGGLLKTVVKQAHAAGLKLKVYYTTRELTQNLPEFFALKSLDGEVFMKRDPAVPGWPITNRGGPHPWLRKHVGMDIIPAWRENVRFKEYPSRLDLAVITTPDTRWDNFYLAGLDYLVREYGIDGLYIDDTALTGKAMQRARRILDRDGRRRLVDNHSWNHHEPPAGAGSSNLVFLDLYPYFDLLWRGEGFYNDTPPDFWLVERSGLPFGLPGEMLGRGNPFRGMLFGMTDRWGWGGQPSGRWKFFDETGMGDAEFTGWWDPASPVKTSGTPDVLASVWRGKKHVVLAVANFSDKPRTAMFKFDNAKLGFDGAKAAWKLPAIHCAQNAGAAPDFAKPVTVPGSGGFILVCPVP